MDFVLTLQKQGEIHKIQQKKRMNFIFQVLQQTVLCPYFQQPCQGSPQFDLNLGWLEFGLVLFARKPFPLRRFSSG